MKYNISTFTHIGTKREINQDRVLVNDIILDNGFHHIIEQPACFCFVADGIGGSVHGEIASRFVLDKILEQKAAFMQIDEQFLESELNNINEELIAYAHQNPEFFGTGTTLNGLIINENNRFVTINAGDSEMWVLRNDMFFQLTELQVFDDAEPGSPLISYFGGKSASLELDLTAPLREIHKDDIFLIASDGLLNALVPKDVKAILLSRQSLQQKSELLLKNALSKGADDNVSCIVVELI